MASTCCYYSWFLMLVLMFFVSLFSPAWSATVSKRQQQHPEGVKQGPITSLAAVTDEELRRDLATIFCNQSCDEGYQPFRSAIVGGAGGGMGFDDRTCEVPCGKVPCNWLLSENSGKKPICPFFPKQYCGDVPTECWANNPPKVCSQQMALGNEDGKQEAANFNEKQSPSAKEIPCDRLELPLYTHDLAEKWAIRVCGIEFHVLKRSPKAVEWGDCVMMCEPFDAKRGGYTCTDDMNPVFQREPESSAEHTTIKNIEGQWRHTFKSKIRANLPVMLGLKEFSTRLKSLDQVLNQLYVMEKKDIPGYWNEQSKMAVFVREILDPVQRSDICRRICPKK